MGVRLSDPVRISETGEVTTIADLADTGRVRFITGTHTGRKIRGERKLVRHFYAELIPEMNGGIEGIWIISEAAFKSRTGSPIEFGES